MTMRLAILLLFLIASPASAQWTPGVGSKTVLKRTDTPNTHDFTAAGSLSAIDWAGCDNDGLFSFDASIGDSSFDARVEWYTCDTPNQERNECAPVRLPEDVEFSGWPANVGRRYLRPDVTIPPTGGDTGRVTATCVQTAYEADVGGGGGGGTDVSVDTGTVLGAADFVDGNRIGFLEVGGFVFADIVASSVTPTYLSFDPATQAELDAAEADADFHHPESHALGGAPHTASPSADIAARITDETGSGRFVFDTQPTFSDFVDLDSIATPANPTAGTSRCYSKTGSDGDICCRNSAGGETCMSDGPATTTARWIEPFGCADPSDADACPQAEMCAYFSVAATVTSVNCHTEAGTESTNGLVKTDPTQAGTNVLSSDIVADTNGEDGGSFLDDSIAAGEYLCPEFVTGGTNATFCTFAGIFD